MTIHLIRHAQGFHNLSVANHAIHDPLLTPLGEQQCRTLQQSFPFMDNLELVVASPLKRTIYTALLSFAPAIQKNNLKVIALPELQETSDLPCDTGSSVEEIEREFAGKAVDTSLMHHPENKDWNNKQGRWAPSSQAIDARATVAREWLYNRPEKEIAVVTHGGFLHYFTQDWSDTHRMDGTPSAGMNSPIHPSLCNLHKSSITASPHYSLSSAASAHSHSTSTASFVSIHSPQSASFVVSDSCVRAASATPRHHTRDHSQHFPHLRKRIDDAKKEIRAYKYAVGTGWSNTEFRDYIFDISTGEVLFVETPQSRKKRLPDQKPLSKEEQKNLQRAAQAQWAEQEKQERELQRVMDVQAKV